MRYLSSILAVLFLVFIISFPGYSGGDKVNNNIGDITVKDINGKDVHLS